MIKVISTCCSLVNLRITASAIPRLMSQSTYLKDGNFIVNKYEVKSGIVSKFGVYFKIAICNIRD